MDTAEPLPKVGAPATNALAAAGVRNMEDLKQADLDHLATLHGVGPKAIRLLREVLED